MKWVEVDPDETPGPHPSDFACRCGVLEQFDLTIEEGSVVLTHPKCGKPVDLDGIGWWQEAPEMQEPVRVIPEFIVEPPGYQTPPEPAYILLTPTAARRRDLPSGNEVLPEYDDSRVDQPLSDPSV